MVAKHAIHKRESRAEHSLEWSEAAQLRRNVRPSTRGGKLNIENMCMRLQEQAIADLDVSQCYGIFVQVAKLAAH